MVTSNPHSGGFLISMMLIDPWEHSNLVTFSQIFGIISANGYQAVNRLRSLSAPLSHKVGFIPPASVAKLNLPTFQPSNLPTL